MYVVFGCGGNRSKERRFEMGEVSGKLADLTIITSDNPRFEEPLEVLLRTLRQVFQRQQESMLIFLTEKKQ